MLQSHLPPPATPENRHIKKQHNTKYKIATHKHKTKGEQQTNLLSNSRKKEEKKIMYCTLSKEKKHVKLNSKIDKNLTKNKTKNKLLLRIYKYGIL